LIRAATRVAHNEHKFSRRTNAQREFHAPDEVGIGKCLPAIRAFEKVAKNPRVENNFRGRARRVNGSSK